MNQTLKKRNGLKRSGEMMIGLTMMIGSRQLHSQFSLPEKDYYY